MASYGEDPRVLKHWRRRHFDGYLLKLRYDQFSYLDDDAVLHRNLAIKAVAAPKALLEIVA